VLKLKEETKVFFIKTRFQYIIEVRDCHD